MSWVSFFSALQVAEGQLTWRRRPGIGSSFDQSECSESHYHYRQSNFH